MTDASHSVARYTTGMSKRLQVVVKDEELERYERTAEAVGLTMSEWVRQSLRAAERQVSTSWFVAAKDDCQPRFGSRRSSLRGAAVRSTTSP